MQQYKALQDLGVDIKNCYTNWFADLNKDKRNSKWKEEKQVYGIDERETWNWCDEYMDYVYIHLEMFNRVNNVNFEIEKITFEGKEMSVQNAIDEILDWYTTEYYPLKEDKYDIMDYKDTKEWQNDLINWMNKKHRIIQLFAEIIEHLSW